MNFEIKLFGYWFIILSQHWCEVGRFYFLKQLSTIHTYVAAGSVSCRSIDFVCIFQVSVNVQCTGLILLWLHCCPPSQHRIFRDPKMIQSIFIFINKKTTYLFATWYLRSNLTSRKRFLAYALGVKITYSFLKTNSNN